MKITIENERIKFNEDAIRYESYYYDIYNGEDRKNNIRKVIKQWLNPIKELYDNQEIIVPYGVEDETVECFRIQRNGQYISLHAIEVECNGFMINLENISDFINNKDLKVWKTYPNEFGCYIIDEFIKAIEEI